MKYKPPCIIELIDQLIYHNFNIDVVAGQLNVTARDVRHELYKCGLDSLDLETLLILQEGLKLREATV